MFGSNTAPSGFFSKGNTSSSNTNNIFGKNGVTTDPSKNTIPATSNISFNQSQTNKPFMSFGGSNPASENKGSFMMSAQKTNPQLPSGTRKLKFC